MRRLFLSFLALLGVSGWVLSAAPVFVGIPNSTTTPPVAPNIPSAKALVLPISAYNAAGEPLSITASSSNPNIFVRVKTGNPVLLLNIQHGGSDAYSGTLAFQIFRDLTPITAGFIAGFAQAGFYDNLTFHRLAFLTDGTTATAGYIYQGGDPNGDGTGGPPFSYQNEFSPGLIFAGRGQLAMANSGYDDHELSSTDTHTLTYEASNGSQFFITDGHPRFLDFEHTIFGQLTHGWELLPDLQATPVTSEKPNNPITITSATVVPRYNDGTHTYTDAVLVLSARIPGTALITLRATDPHGVSTVATFVATSADDTQNSRPFVSQPENLTLPIKKVGSIPLNVVDLERDYVSVTTDFLNDTDSTNPKGFSQLQGSNLLVEGNPSYQATSTTTVPYSGPLDLHVAVTQYDPIYGSLAANQRAIDNHATATIGVGEMAITGQPLTFEVAPGSPGFSGVVARYADTDPRAQAGDNTATINWGDGTAVSTGAIARDTSRPTATGFQITGSHTYAKPGIYRVETEVQSTQGLDTTIVSQAVVSASTLVAAGEDFTVTGRLVTNRVIATFTDTDSPVAASGYTAEVDWGDGAVIAGKIVAGGNGQFSVTGSHSFVDAQNYPISVRVQKTGSTVPEAVAWSLARVSGFAGPHYLPPFDQSHLVGEWTSVPILNSANQQIGTYPTKQTVGSLTVNSETYFTYKLTLLNSGNLISPVGTVRLYLSPDTTLNRTATGTGATATPADIPLAFTVTNNVPQYAVTLPMIKPGTSISYLFQSSKLGDFRLRAPRNETGTGFHILADLSYPDPVSSHEPIAHDIPTPVVQGILVTPATVTTSEAGTTGTFSVQLDKKPTATVTIPLAGVDATEGSIDKTSLVFDSTNWLTPQVVTVTGKPDSATAASGSAAAVDGTQYYQITVGPAVSTDPIYSGMTGPSVTVANADRDGNVTVSPTTLTTDELETSAKHTATFTVALSAALKQTVSVTMHISNAAEGEFLNASGASVGQDYTITFSPPATGSTPPPISQTVTIRAKNDGVQDGNTTYLVTFDPVTSTDPNFGGIQLPNISVTNNDAQAATTP